MRPLVVRGRLDILRLSPSITYRLAASRIRVIIINSLLFMGVLAVSFCVCSVGCYA
jgi:hypothetical protein